MPSWKLSKEIGLLRDPQLLPISVVSLVDESHGLYDIMQPHQTHQALRLKLRRIFPRGSSRDTHSIWSSGKRERIYIANGLTCSWQYMAAGSASVKSSGTVGGGNLFAYPLFGMSFRILTPRGRCSLLSRSPKHFIFF